MCSSGSSNYDIPSNSENYSFSSQNRKQISNNDKENFAPSTKQKINDHKIDREILNEIFKLFKIEIDLDEDFSPTNPKYFCGENKLFYLFDDAKYDKNNIEEKNFMKYLNYIETIKNYIKLIKYRIIYRGKIILELTKESEKQNESEEINLEDKDLYDVKCVYTIDGNKEIKFIDENILVYGIDGKRQGFLFLVNEICSDDYEDY